MAISIKTPAEIEIMRQGGKILAETLHQTLKRAQVGVSTLELDQFAEEFIRSKGAEPGFKGFNGFPATICPAINDIVVHGIPSDNQIIADGDLLTIDCGVKYKGFYSDAARSIQVGTQTPEANRLIKTAHKALKRGLKKAIPGNRVNEISKAIQEIIESAGYHVIRDLTGHGIGRDLHEDPVVLNYYDKREGKAVLKPGMTMAVEPIFAVGTGKMRELKDNWTIVTADQSLSVQVEETVLITESGVEILTKFEEN